MKRIGITLALIVACDKGAASSVDAPPSPQDGSPAQADASPAEPPKAQPTDETPTQVAPRKPEPEEWLVWWQGDEGWHTRWYATDEAAKLTTRASVDAIVIADETQLWHVRRADSTIKVFDCACLDGGDDDPRCAARSKVTLPGLQAVAMDGTFADLQMPSLGGQVFGEIDERSLRVLGGVGTRVFSEASDVGYYCGAHAEASTEHSIAALAEEAQTELRALKIALPQALLDKAAKARIYDDYVACEGETTREQFVADHLRLATVASFVEGGEPRLVWGFEVSVPYVCSSDYVLYTEVRSGLLPEAEALGLAGPLSPGLKAALADVDSAFVAGWSKVDFEDHEKALAWLEDLDAKPWPPEAFAGVDLGAKGKTALAKKHLHAGRKLTREGDHAKAIAELTQAVEADPSLVRPWAALCYARLLAEEFEQSKKDCQTALSKKPGANLQAAIEFNLGTGAERQGDLKAAKAHYEASLKLRENEDVQEALDRVIESGGAARSASK